MSALVQNPVYSKGDVWCTKFAKIIFLSWPFYTLSHDSVTVLWFHIGAYVSVHVSVYLSKYQWIFTKLGICIDIVEAGLGGAVGCASDWRPGGRGFDPRRGRQHSFVEIDHEIFSTVILSLPLIQEGQLSVSGERMCTILVNRLED